MTTTHQPRPTGRREQRHGETFLVFERTFRAPIEDVWAAVTESDRLARWIGEAGGNRRRLLAGAYEDPGAMQRVRVHVPDRPGVLSGITQALGAEKINIEDFELDHLSPERGGTLDVLVEGPSRYDPSRLRGRTSHNKVVNFDGLAAPGEIVPVEIATATSQSLTGT